MVAIEEKRVSAQALCPSAQPNMPGAEILGVLDSGPIGHRLAYLDERVAVTTEILALAEGVSPTRIMRFAAPCEERACRHFDGADCRLAKRIVEGLAESVTKPPPCRIRPSCRWFAQEGRAACLRCPQVVTEICAPTPAIMAIALGAELTSAVRNGAEALQEGAAPATDAALAGGL